MNDDNSESRNTSGPAMSVGRPHLPSTTSPPMGGVSLPSGNNLGVRITSGATQLTRMPCGPHSAAIARDNDISPALAAPYAAWRAAP